MIKEEEKKTSQLKKHSFPHNQAIKHMPFPFQPPSIIIKPSLPTLPPRTIPHLYVRALARTYLPTHVHTCFNPPPQKKGAAAGTVGYAKTDIGPSEWAEGVARWMPQRLLRRCKRCNVGELGQKRADRCARCGAPRYLTLPTIGMPYSGKLGGPKKKLGGVSLGWAGLGCAGKTSMRRAKAARLVGR